MSTNCAGKSGFLISYAAYGMSVSWHFLRKPERIIFSSSDLNEDFLLDSSCQDV